MIWINNGLAFLQLISDRFLKLEKAKPTHQQVANFESINNHCLRNKFGGQFNKSL